MQRRLNKAQRQLAEEAVKFVGPSVAGFCRRHPSYARVLRHCDLHSVARIAVCKAAFTFDPRKSQPTTYFGSAIRHELLKEVRRVQRSRVAAVERVSLERALSERFSRAEQAGAIRCLESLEPPERELVDAHILRGHSLNSLARERGCDWRTLRIRLRAALADLATCLAACTDSTSDSPLP